MCVFWHVYLSILINQLIIIHCNNCVSWPNKQQSQLLGQSVRVCSCTCTYHYHAPVRRVASHHLAPLSIVHRTLNACTTHVYWGPQAGNCPNFLSCRCPERKLLNRCCVTFFSSKLTVNCKYCRHITPTRKNKVSKRHYILFKEVMIDVWTVSDILIKFLIIVWSRIRYSYSCRPIIHACLVLQKYEWDCISQRNVQFWNSCSFFKTLIEWIAPI